MILPIINPVMVGAKNNKLDPKINNKSDIIIIIFLPYKSDKGPAIIDPNALAKIAIDTMVYFFKINS